VRIYFSTVVRNAPPLRGGELVCLDWGSKQVLGRVPVAAADPPLNDPNPRGNTRGGRGIALVGDEVIVASYHTLHCFDRELRPRRKLSHPLMAGLHEVAPTGRGSLWVSSTAIDAALEIDLASGKALRELWPREQPGLARALGLSPLAIDKEADNRTRFVAGDHLRDRSHLHLNAVAEHAGDVYALLNRQGAIANLSRDAVAVKHRSMRKGHNLSIDESGVAWWNDTSGRRTCAVDLAGEGPRRRIPLLRYPEVARVARRLDRRRRLLVRLQKWGLLRAQPPLPIFVRGLVRHAGHLFVGFSPAAILQIDEESGALVDAFRYSRDVHCCVHGLALSTD
jgi:hypothetical protein